MRYTLSVDWTQIIDENINVIDCIHKFDAGYGRIYVVDAQGKFNGMVIEKEIFSCIFEENLNSWYRFLEDKEYITSIYTEEDLQKAIIACEENSDYEEIPIIIEGQVGSILKLIREDVEKDINWNVAITARAVEFMTRYPTICISSLQSNSMKEFYRRYVTWVKIIVLNENNIDELMNSKYDLFIYEEDLYDSLQINKLSLKEVHKRFAFDYFKWKPKEFVIGSDWPSLNIKNCTVLNCIKEFDKGYNSVYLVDDEENYITTVCIHNFKEDLLQDNFRRWNNVCVEYCEDIEEQMNTLMTNYFGTARQDVPIIKNKKIVGNCQKKIYWNYPKPRLKWEYISEEIVVSYFKNRKILISSLEGELGIFYHKYSQKLNLDILDEKNLDRYFTGAYEVVIYLSDVWWNNNITIYLNLYQVYLDLLGIYADRYFKNKGIPFYYFESSNNPNEILNYDKRHHRGHIEEVIPSGERRFVKLDDCYTYPNVTEENCHIYNGIRITSGNIESAKNNIYFFGACTSMGWNVKDDETIESYLQQILIRKDIYYNVINSGGVIGASAENDIATLHLILKQEYHANDLVIQIGFRMWNSELGSKIKDVEYYRLADLFNTRDHYYERYFMDWTPHINPIGNTRIAEYIYRIISKDLFDRCD